MVLKFRVSNKGFNLIELLFAMVISTILVLGLITIYLSIKMNYNLQQALASLQDSARFAINTLNQRIRLAGFLGCADDKNPVDTKQALIGYDSQHLPGSLVTQVVSGTDALVVTSCVSNFYIAKNAEITSMAYYIGDTGRKNSQGQSILALYQKPAGSDREELVSGVEQMQIQYGLAPEGNDVAYYTAEQIIDWQLVRSVKIDLLLNSIEPILTQPQTYYFHGKTIISNDRLLHKVWSTYVALRERIQLKSSAT